jgi:hypothetical protein
VDRVTRRLEAERQAVLAQLREGVEAAADHPRPRLGGTDPGPAGVREPPGQADLRLVRRGDRLPLGVDRVGREPRHTRRLAGVVAEPGGRARLLHGEGQHRLSHGDLAEHAARLRGQRCIRRRPGRPRASRQHRVQRVPDHGGERS